MPNSLMRMLRACGACLLLLVATRADAASITLAWDPNPEPDVAGYALLYGTRQGDYSSRIDVGNRTEYTVASLPDGVYYFTVVAYDVEGTLSPISNEVTATLVSAAAPTPVVVPAPVVVPPAPIVPPAPAVVPPTVVIPAPPASSCSSTDPFGSMGGGTCYAGGWLPPGMAVPGGTPAPPAPAPVPTLTPAPSVWTCITPDPFSGMGGGTCYAGGWLPPGMPVPGGASAPSAPAVRYSPAPSTYTPAPVSSAPSTCSTPDPFAALGGGSCYAGGWLPPGMPVPAGWSSAPTPAAPPAATPAPTAAVSSDCTTPDPFISLQGLVGACNNGGWVPVAGIRGTGTIRTDDLGRWVIVGDSGITYAPLSLSSTLQLSGLRVSMTGIPQGTENGATVIQLLTVSIF